MLDAKRPALGDMPEWNLTDLYTAPDSPEVTHDFEMCRERAKAFSAHYAGKLAVLAGDALGGAIAEYEQIQETLSKLMTYAFLSYSVAMNDQKRGAFYQGTAEKVTDISSDLLFFTLEINKIDDAALDEKLKSSVLAKYAPWLRDLRASRPHQLSDELEQFIHQMSVSTDEAWTRLYEETLASLRFTVNGEEMNEAELLTLLQNPDRATRQVAGEELARVLKANVKLFAHAHNTLIKSKTTEDKWRKFAKPQDSRHLSNLIEGDVVDALHKTVKEAYPRLSHRYYRLKAKWLGLEKLEYWDRNAPLPEKEDRLIPWAEAQETVLKAYASFCPELARRIEPFFAKGWIDAPTREGKEGGAYSHPCVPSVHPYILMNYQGKPRDVMTLAHELGHGVHQVLAGEAQGHLLADTPLTLAETASVFGEMLTFRSLLASENDPKKRKVLIATKVEEMLATVVRQIAMYDFELRLHTERCDGEVSPERIGELWLETQRESLGEAFIYREEAATFWAYVTHFVRTPFYVYAYAFGDCLVNALYATYQAQPEGFADKYLGLLRAGGTKRHRELLAPFGLDATDPAFWQRGLSVIEGLIDDLEAMG